ncbi:MAG: inverse autotransporter beta domain-containing protein [Verrucomicrobiae bacterium]|nr:inverse autotransporter beta domain-containing protein [Verrucomicrobiae bacterium]
MRAIRVGFCCLIAVASSGGGVRGEGGGGLGSVLDEPCEAREGTGAGSITLGGHVSESLTDGFADIHAPMWRPGAHSFFFNPRVFATDDSLERYSLGGGWRWLLAGPQVIVGANAYWDHLESPHGFGYEQLGAGAEVLTRWVDARFNYYLPEEGVRSAGGATTEELGRSEPTRDGEFLVHETRYRDSWWWHKEAALQGYYGEVGFLVPGLDKWAELRLFGGYYSYQAASGDPLWEPSYEGFKARAELRLPPAITLDVEYVDDEEIMGGNWIGGVRVTVPFEVGNIFRGKNPFEGIGEMFRPRRREFAERMGEMVMRSPRVAIAEQNGGGASESSVIEYEYAPTGGTGGEAGGGGVIIVNGGGARYGEPVGGTLTVSGGYPGSTGGFSYPGSERPVSLSTNLVYRGNVPPPP